jgi:IclR family transcriptional regulator, acetate operon repressor
MIAKPRDSGVKSADRALAIIELVADRGSVRFQDILSSMSLARSSAHGLLRTLVDSGWLHHNAQTRTYSLGLRAWQVGQRYDGHRELANIAAAEMDALAHTVGETVQLARLDGIENVYIAISESPHPFRLASSVGMRLYSHATALGKALLSQLDPDEARRRLTSVELPAFTERTVYNSEQILSEVALVRERGYATDEGEYLSGTRCVAIPLIHDGTDLITAISVTAPAMRTTEDWPAPVLSELQDTAARIRSQLGYGRLKPAL